MTADCLTCQNNQPKPKHLNEVPLEEWQNEAVPFRTVHIDHKGHLHPISASNAHCLLIIDALSRFLMVYSVRNSTALATVSAVEKRILSSGISQSIMHDRVTAFIKTEFINRTKELGIILRTPPLTRSGQMAKLKPKTNILIGTGEIFLMMPEITGLRLHRRLHSHTTQLSTIKLANPYEYVFATKPQIPMSLKLGLYPNKHKLCCSDFCMDLPSHSHTENSLKNELMDNLLELQLSQVILERERTFEHIHSSTFERCREQTAQSHVYRNSFKPRHHLEVG